MLFDFTLAAALHNLSTTAGCARKRVSLLPDREVGIANHIEHDPPLRTIVGKVSHPGFRPEEVIGEFGTASEVFAVKEDQIHSQWRRLFFPQCRHLQEHCHTRRPIVRPDDRFAATTLIRIFIGS